MRRLAALLARGPFAVALALCALPAAAQQAGASAVQPGAQPGAQSGTHTATQTEAQPGTLPPGMSPLQPLSGGFTLISPLTTPTVSPGALTLLELDGKLNQAVEKGGGPAFVAWFAPDAVTLNNGKPAIQGRNAIAASATWKPADYQLSWTPQGASMGPSNDMGYTWGIYEGRSRDSNGQPVTTTGRYITLWRKQADGTWKIALEASADAPPGAGACCALPKP